ncbi:hypothetical protein [Emticicia sp. 17c]|uniref:hypothetical protein n=1 Tax=Emticicia sp. 17c TaxID=3127704 RepID=UPI00301D65E1
MRSKNTLYKFNEESLPENFVSIAVNIHKDKIEPTHAAILIRHENINYLHHFPGQTLPEVIDNFNESGWYIYKIINFIEVGDSYEVGAFLQYCRRVCKNSNITYSYIADGSSYNDRGQFISRIGLPEFGTCVGFCLNTLSNAILDIENSIIELDDWDDSEILQWVDNQSVLQVQKKYPDLDWNLYNAFKKRITPLEYLCISFFDDYPIKKNEVDKIKGDILNRIKSMYN